MLAPNRLVLFRSRCGCCFLIVCFTSTGQAGNSILFRNACRKDFRGQEIPGISQTWRVSRQQWLYLIRLQAWNNQWSNISSNCCNIDSSSQLWCWFLKLLFDATSIKDHRGSEVCLSCRTFSFWYHPHVLGAKLENYPLLWVCVVQPSVSGRKNIKAEIHKQEHWFMCLHQAVL